MINIVNLVMRSLGIIHASSHHTIVLFFAYIAMNLTWYCFYCQNNQKIIVNTLSLLLIDVHSSFNHFNMPKSAI